MVSLLGEIVRFAHGEIEFVLHPVLQFSPSIRTDFFEIPVALRQIFSCLITQKDN